MVDGCVYRFFTLLPLRCGAPKGQRSRSGSSVASVLDVPSNHSPTIATLSLFITNL